LAGNPTFYNFSSGTTAGTYGRDVYNVVKTTKLGALVGQRDFALQDLLNATTQATPNTNPNGICVSASARTTVHNFGFLDSVLACGATSLTGAS
jgi:hypothetical protein